MRNFIFILLFIISGNKLIAQKPILTQKEWFESGKKYLRKGKIETAAAQFYLANNLERKSHIGILAQQKFDSLLPLVHKKIIAEWKGNWKGKELKQEQYPEKFSEYISIDEDKIVFYHKDPNGEKIITRTELIKFAPYNGFYFHRIIFKNSEIWEFEIGKKKSQKRLYPQLKLDSLGTYYKVIDERVMIANRKLRKKEMEKEIYTFYLISE